MSAKLVPLEVPIAPETLEWLEANPIEGWLVARFAGLMLDELAINDSKGNRLGWLKMNPGESVAELLYHAGKLSLAVREVGSGKDPDPRTAGFSPADVSEFSADVANCSLMVLDCCGLLDRIPAPSNQGEGR